MHKLFIAVFFLICSQTQAQKAVSWETLSQVRYESVKRDGPMWFYGKATFAPEIQQLAGKEIQIQGYVLPIDETGGLYVLSRYPYSTCFFCGAAGQESVMELIFEKPLKFKMDEIATFRGVLELESKELSINYRLLKAKLVSRL